MDDQRRDAFVAAVVEDEAGHKGLGAPAGVDQTRQFVDPEWCVIPYSELAESERASAPAG